MQTTISRNFHGIRSARDVREAVPYTHAPILIDLVGRGLGPAVARNWLRREQDPALQSRTNLG